MFYVGIFHIDDTEPIADFMNDEEGIRKFVSLQYVGDKRVAVTMSDSKKPPPKPVPEPEPDPENTETSGEGADPPAGDNPPQGDGTGGSGAGETSGATAPPLA